MILRVNKNAGGIDYSKDIKPIYDEIRDDHFSQRK